MRDLVILGVVLLLVGTSGSARAQSSAENDPHRFHSVAVKKTEGDARNAPSAALSAFEKIKTLVGDWEARDGVSYGGKPIRVSYKIVSGGTSVMETYYQVGGDYIDMVTLYHLDGDKLMLTHFCDVNNQVRMTAESITGDVKALQFNYLDATNLSVASKEIINKLKIVFQDPDHFTQAWTWRMTNDKGKTFDDKAVYNFVRRK